MKPTARLVIASFCAVLLAISIPHNAKARRGRKKKKKTAKTVKASTPVLRFLKENGVNLDQKVVAIRVSGNDNSSETPRAVVKHIALRDGDPKGARKGSGEIIRTVITYLGTGEVVETGDTEKVADLEVFLKDGSSFKVLVGEDFSQLVFDKNVLSFKSEGLTKSVKIILKQKGTH